MKAPRRRLLSSSSMLRETVHYRLELMWRKSSCEWMQRREVRMTMMTAAEALFCFLLSVLSHPAVQVCQWRDVYGRVFCVPCQFCYTRFSTPGKGCGTGAGGSVLPACWASWRTGMLHSGHTFLTSSHLMRHLGDRTGMTGHGLKSQPNAHLVQF